MEQRGSAGTCRRHEPAALPSGHAVGVSLEVRCHRVKHLVLLHLRRTYRAVPLETFCSHGLAHLHSACTHTHTHTAHVRWWRRKAPPAAEPPHFRWWRRNATVARAPTWASGGGSTNTTWSPDSAHSTMPDEVWPPAQACRHMHANAQIQVSVCALQKTRATDSRNKLAPHILTGQRRSI